MTKPINEAELVAALEALQPVTPEPAHSDLLSRLDATGQSEFSYDEDKEEAATTIRNLQAEIELYREALERVIKRSHNGELGTSKVIDMRTICHTALDQKEQ